MLFVDCCLFINVLLLVVCCWFIDGLLFVVCCLLDWQDEPPRAHASRRPTTFWIIVFASCIHMEALVKVSLSCDNYGCCCLFVACFLLLALFVVFVFPCYVCYLFVVCCLLLFLCCLLLLVRCLLLFLCCLLFVVCGGLLCCLLFVMSVYSLLFVVICCAVLLVFADFVVREMLPLRLTSHVFAT